MRSWGWFSCSTPIRGRISAAPPRCSPNTRLEKGDCVSEEQRGDDAETPSRIGVDHEN